MQDQEALLESVSELVTLAGEGIKETLASLPRDANENDFSATLDACQANVETVAMAAEIAQMAGLQQLCAEVSETLSKLNSHMRAFQTFLGPRLYDWCEAVQLYIRQPDANGITTPLLAFVPSDQRDAFRLKLSGSKPESIAYEQAESEQAESEQAESDLAEPKLEENLVNEQDHTVTLIPTNDQTFDHSEINTSEPIGENSEVAAEWETELDHEVTETSARDIESTALAVLNTEADESLETDQFSDVASTQLNEVFTELERLQAILLQAPTLAADELQTICTSYNQANERLQAVGMVLGLNGFGIACELLQQNIKVLPDVDSTLRMEAINQLADWPNIAKVYLEAPEEEQRQLALLELLMHSGWPQPLTEEQAEELVSTLESSGEEFLADAEQRPTVAQPEDVDLTIDADVNPKLIEVFMQESPANAADFSAAVERLIRNEDVLKNLAAAQRLAHNLKGSANLVGVKGLANMTHHCEDILEYLTERQAAPRPALAHTLQEAADCIEAMLESLPNGVVTLPGAQQVLQSIFDWANRMDAGLLNTPVEETRATQSVEIANNDELPAKAEIVTTNVASPAATDESASTNAAATIGKTIRVPTDTIDMMFRLIGEVSIALDQLQERFEGFRRLSNEVHHQDSVVQQRRFELENFIDVRHVANTQQRLRQLSHGQEDFDPLELDQYDELYSTTRSFIESVVDSRRMSQNLRGEFATLERALVPLRRMKGDLQLAVLKTRMEPIASIVARLHRSVRQAARVTNKQIDLSIEGSEIQLDTEVLERLAEPLMHMLRNAADHGIEAPEERLAKGKSEVGVISLRFFQEGQSVVIECVDDGRGLDHEQIRVAAVEKGLLPNDANVSNDELARMIMVPGFSTRTNVTQLSGRGVGMDVVQTVIRDLKGIVEISDARTGGCQISLRLPITLLTNHSLVVQINADRFAIPTSSIMQVISPRQGQFTQIGNQLAYEIGQDAYHAATLNACLGYASSSETPTTDNSVVIVYSDTGPVAIAVDQLVNSYDLIVKSLGRYVGSIRGIAGLSSLADGSLIPVLDIAELLRTPVQSSDAIKSVAKATTVTTTSVQRQAAAQIMIVDDSISVRQTLSDMIEEAGYETIIARDGLEAVDLLRQHTPDLVLSDIEMPRMNGLELASYIRTSHSTELPIIIITSRTMQKHRQQAAEAGVNGYVTKPFDENELLARISSFL